MVLGGPEGHYHREVAAESRVSQLFVAVSEVMTAAGIVPRQLGLVGVGRGPGSFTGVRVAVTAAKFLAAVVDVPLVAPDSLMVTAAGTNGDKDVVFVALDARRGEVYHALYRLDGGYPVAQWEPCVAPPEAAAASLASWMEKEEGRVKGAGNGIEMYRDLWPRGLERVDADAPDPAGLARLCRLAAGRGEYEAPIELLPLYLRRPDIRERCGEGERGSPC